MTTPRAVHTTVRHLSAIISRTETEIRRLEEMTQARYRWQPKLTDAQVADARRQIKAKEAELVPMRKALAALAVVIGEGLA